MTDIRAKAGMVDVSAADNDAAVLGGRYRLDAVLGRGGMAVVYAGTDLVLDRRVAVKVFRNDGDATDSARYEQEARILASLGNPGLVTVFDAGIDANGDQPRPFLVMELVAGATLADVLGDGPLAPAEVARLGAEVATALAYVHRHGVVHRDVKPANILLPAGEDGDRRSGLAAKLADFGIARLVDGGRLTTTNRALGTVRYVSPEQVTGDAVGPAGDVYSLGLVLAECLTGDAVYPGDGVDAASARLLGEPQLADTLPSEWARLLRGMLERDPGRRPTAAEVSVALTGLTAVARPAADTDTTTIPVVDDIRPAIGPDPGDDDGELGPNPTRVLEIPQSAGASRARRMPEPVRRRPPPWRAIVAAAVLVLLIVLIVVTASNTSLPTPSAPPPAYPTAPGQLGTDLRDLQQQVQP
ncbi:MAG: eukaryotic-like serine/threonine-protein kinase [Pseudonocardiales bacterium]|nr:eukaryotic-like serine/threonine-protein kinase [Pseudonocardiales bacterium]